MTGVAGWHKRTAGWTTGGGRGHRQSRCRSENGDWGLRTCVHLHRRTGLVGCARWVPPGQALANSLKPGGYGLAGPGNNGNSRRPPPGAPNILPLLTRLSIARSTSACTNSSQLHHPLASGINPRASNAQQDHSRPSRVATNLPSGKKMRQTPHEESRSWPLQQAKWLVGWAWQLA